MLKNDDGCIRYLMKEMDPSEEIEFERAMMEDQNLLIEVEVLRKTYNRLGRLPIQHPPKSLIQKVSLSAIQIQRQQLREANKWLTVLTRNIAAAAVLLMVASSALYFGGIFLESETLQEGTSVTTSGVVEPWVDRNQILRFSDMQNGSPTQILQTEVTQSFNKLILVNDRSNTNVSSDQILLTNSPQ